VVNAHPLHLGRPPIEHETLIRAEMETANAEQRPLLVDHFSVEIDPADRRVQMRLVGRPEAGARNGSLLCNSPVLAGRDQFFLFGGPWRIVLIGESWNALMNSDIIHNVSAPPDPKLADARDTDRDRTGSGLHEIRDRHLFSLDASPRCHTSTQRLVTRYRSAKYPPATSTAPQASIMARRLTDSF